MNKILVFLKDINGRFAMLVKDLMTTSVSFVRPDDTVAAAVKIMRSENAGIVPVCDVQKHVLGVITDRDILMRTGSYSGESADFEACAVQDVMTCDVFCVDIKADIHEAALLMSEKGVRRLPVLENEKLAGMLSLKDLAKKRIFIAEIGHIIYELSKK